MGSRSLALRLLLGMVCLALPIPGWLQGSSAASWSIPSPQRRQVEQQPAFEAHVDMVMLSVSVTDAEGLPVTGLTREDFFVREDGMEREVVVVLDPAKVPLDIALLMDFSGSMQVYAEEARKNALTLLDQLSGEDCVYYQPFDVALGTGYWGDPQDPRLRELVSTPSMEGGTALYDAVVETMFRLQYGRKRCGAPPSSIVSTEERSARRKALLVVTDGFDRNSVLSFEHVLGAAGQAEVPVFPVTVGDVNLPRPILRKRASDAVWRGLGERETWMFASQLRRLAEATGGQTLNGGATPEALSEAYEEILRWLRASYAVGYYSEAVDPRNTDLEIPVWHEVEVRVRGRGHSVHARPGYYYSPINAWKSRFHVEAAVGLLAERKASEALLELDLAIGADRYLWEPYYHRGGALALLGDLHAAQRAFLQAATLNPGHARAHELACLASLEIGDYEEAWEQAIRAHQAGASMAVEFEQLRRQTSPPPDFEDRLRATRVLVVPGFPPDPPARALLQRILRTVRSALAGDPLIGLVESEESSEYRLDVTSETGAGGTSRGLEVRLSLSDRDGELIDSLGLTLAHASNQEEVAGEVENYVRALDEWLRKR